MVFRTSRNLTILGVLGVLGALVQAATLVFDGDPATNPDFGVLITVIYTSVVSIMSKGQQNTGGTVVS